MSSAAKGTREVGTKTNCSLGGWFLAHWEQCQPEWALERLREESGGGKVNSGFRSITLRKLTNGARARAGYLVKDGLAP